MPYAQVDAIIRSDPQTLVASGGRVVDGEVRIQLTAHLPGIGLGVAAEAAIVVGTPEAPPGPIPSLRVPLSWHATHAEQFFPEMHGYLEAFPTTSSATELAIAGEYVPPLGAVGAVVDHAVMHRVAEESVVALLEAIATEIKERRHAFDEVLDPHG